MTPPLDDDDDAGGRAGALDRIKQAVGPKGWTDDPDGLDPFNREWRGRYRGAARFAVMPATTEEVSAVLGIAYAAGIPVVPQGGNTGLVGGAVTGASEIVLSTRRLDRIRAIDPANATITVEAGVVLQAIQDAAAEHDRLFPLSLGAEGTCQIGGNLATNAGGTGVLRYGNTRDLVLGLEVVLPDGRIWHGLTGLRKDNTGYDLKHLFVGAEGTLGVITAAVLKLFPKPRQWQTAFCAVPDPQAAVDLLARMRDGSGDMVTTFELIARTPLAFAVAHVDGATDPLAEPSPWYVLVELTSSVADAPLRDQLETVLGAAFEDGLVTDAAIAESGQQRDALWFIREAIVEAQAFEGGSIKHDISVPVSAVPAFLDRALAKVEEIVPGARPCPFGHVGDGNLHFNISQPAGADRDAFLAEWDRVAEAVHDIAVDLGGSISAEHGIGLLKRAELARRKDPVALDLMRAVKQAVDPKGLMNPGKVV
ncbi:MAG: FAD-binding protein [Alphaproteobacteria bacterium]|jgi:FAD/FMN-containing dehydrogenase|nr:FAD-binding protein [Alphaproteobacteria bacterium]